MGLIRMCIRQFAMTPHDKTWAQRQELHPTTRVAPNDKTCTQRQDLHPTTRVAPKDKSCTQRQELHPTTRVAPKDKTCTHRQDLHPTRSGKNNSFGDKSGPHRSVGAHIRPESIPPGLGSLWNPSRAPK